MCFAFKKNNIDGEQLNETAMFYEVQVFVGLKAVLRNVFKFSSF